MKMFKGMVATAAMMMMALATTGCPPDRGAAAKTSGDIAAEGATSDAGDELVGDSTITRRELDLLRSNFERVHFDFDSSTLDEPSREILAANADILVKHPDVRVRVEGHADHWGSDIYNLALGQRRAEAVRGYLTALGVSSAQLELISYGEERPLVGDGERSAEAPNRRAEFLVIVAGESAIGSSY